MINKMKLNYTDDELIRRAWDIEDIKDLTSRRVFYYANDMRAEEIEDLWVKDPENQKTASFGMNWGYYVGIDHIKKFYVEGHEKRRREMLESICAKNPQISCTEDNIGLGCMQVSPLTTPQLELAGDGKTARCIWFCTGMVTELKDDLTPSSNWAFEHMGIDYIKEGDDWKIWHLYTSLELYYESGTDLGNQPLEPSLPENPFEKEFGKPDIEFLTHNVRYNWWDEYPAEPEPYDVFDEKQSYAPAGHPALASDEAMEKWKRGIHKW